MTVQIEDSFVWKKKQYYFETAKDFSSVRLFEPKDYGFVPSAPHTACWKGFVLFFRINEEDELLIDALKMNDINDYYPEINGVKAIKDREIDNSFHIYKDLNLKLSNYSGEIYINSKPSMIRFREKENERIKVIIKNGKLIDFELLEENSEISKDFLKKEYYYLTVVYDASFHKKKYNYISLDTTIKVGDIVLVDNNGSVETAEVVETGFYNRFNSPYPVELTKTIIGKYEKNEKP